MNINLLNKTLLNGLSFKGRIKTEGTLDDNPLAYFGKTASQYARQNQNDEFILQRNLSNQGLINHLRENVLPNSSVVQPSLDNSDDGDNFIKNQILTHPKPLDPNVAAMEESVITNIQEGRVKASVDSAKKFNKELESIELDDVSKPYKLFSKGIDMKINNESIQFKNLVNSTEPAIFVFNHPDPPKDLAMFYSFISQLYGEYKEKNDKSENGINYPKPQCIVTNREYDVFPEKLKKMYDKGGFVPIVSKAYPSAENNTLKMASVMNNFAEGNHIFIAPEGGRRFLNLSNEEKFNYGISKVIMESLTKMPRVKVIPIGIHCEKNKGDIAQGAVHIGKPIYFKMENNTIAVTKGDIDSEFKNKNDNSFYEKIAEKPEEEYTPLKYGNKNINLDTESSKKAMARVIGGVLCTDLAIVSDKAENDSLT